MKDNEIFPIQKLSFSIIFIRYNHDVASLFWADPSLHVPDARHIHPVWISYLWFVSGYVPLTALKGELLDI
jgi:hypothetical protein